MRIELLNVPHDGMKLSKHCESYGCAGTKGSMLHVRCATAPMVED